MGQVPKNNYLIIGNGRVANHFKKYFEYLEVSFLSWNKKTPKPLDSLINRSTHILLLISDRSIEPFYQKHLQKVNKPVIHFSGSLTITGILGMHPLSSFSHELYDLETYRKIPFITEKDSSPFEDMFPQLPNPSYQISKEDRGLYHALCVSSGNFTNILWSNVLQEFEKTLKLDSQILKPYLEQVFRNIANDPFDSITGPLSRGDQTTIDNNLRELSGSPFEDLYRSFLVFESARKSQSDGVHS